MKSNSGSFYAAAQRGDPGTSETCLICHGTGGTADIAVVHSKNR